MVPAKIALDRFILFLLCAGINRRVSLRMKVPLSEGLATHTGHESCTGVRKFVCEALIMVCIGWVLSLVTKD